MKRRSLVRIPPTPSPEAITNLFIKKKSVGGYSSYLVQRKLYPMYKISWILSFPYSKSSTSTKYDSFRWYMNMTESWMFSYILYRSLEPIGEVVLWAVMSTINGEKFKKKIKNYYCTCRMVSSIGRKLTCSKNCFAWINWQHLTLIRLNLLWGFCMRLLGKIS